MYLGASTCVLTFIMIGDKPTSIIVTRHEVERKEKALEQQGIIRDYEIQTSNWSWQGQKIQKK